MFSVFSFEKEMRMDNRKPNGWKKPAVGHHERSCLQIKPELVHFTGKHPALGYTVIWTSFSN